MNGKEVSMIPVYKIRAWLPVKLKNGGLTWLSPVYYEIVEPETVLTGVLPKLKIFNYYTEDEVMVQVLRGRLKTYTPHLFQRSTMQFFNWLPTMVAVGVPVSYWVLSIITS